MARHFTVTLTSGTNNGPYTIYHTSSTNGNQALLYGTSNQATNLTLAQVQGGVLITVPDSATSVIFYNNNATIISDCPTNIVEYPLSPSGPTATPNATPNETPQPSATVPDSTPNATPNPTATVPDATPNATQMPTYTPTPIPSATPSPTTELETYYRLERCNDSQDYHVPKIVYCENGNLTVVSDPGYSIGDVVQFRGTSNSGCGGATYCATVISTTFTAPPGSENGYISRIPIVPGCDDFLHCGE